MEELLELQGKTMDLQMLIIAYVIFFTIGFVETRIWK